MRLAIEKNGLRVELELAMGEEPPEWVMNLLEQMAEARNGFAEPISVRDVAHELGCSRQTVYGWVERGLLSEVVVGGTRYIGRQSFGEFREWQGQLAKLLGSDAKRKGERQKITRIIYWLAERGVRNLDALIQWVATRPNFAERPAGVISNQNLEAFLKNLRNSQVDPLQPEERKSGRKERSFPVESARRKGKGRLLSVAEAAEQLGVTPKTVYEWMAKGILPEADEAYHIWEGDFGYLSEWRTEIAKALGHEGKTPREQGEVTMVQNWLVERRIFSPKDLRAKAEELMAEADSERAGMSKERFPRFIEILSSQEEREAERTHETA